MNSKQDQLATLKAEKLKLQQQVTDLESHISISNLVMRERVDASKDIELKLMGLELTEEAWEKKYA